MTSDPWARLRDSTRARIGLGRAGDALPTHALLDFQYAHARARDAVHKSADFTSIAQQLAPRRSIRVESRAIDRATYLRRPDHGRLLSDRGRHLLSASAEGTYDLAFVIADGLSAGAVTRNAVPVIRTCLEQLDAWAIAPIILVDQGRVAIGDEITAMLGARMCAVLIGERPGLSVAESMGIYITWSPVVGTRDSARNCISNIHADGLSIASAAHIATWLIRQGSQRRLTGIGLKEEAGPASSVDIALPAPGKHGQPLLEADEAAHHEAHARSVG